jgi:hypothetical protein
VSFFHAQQSVFHAAVGGAVSVTDIVVANNALSGPPGTPSGVRFNDDGSIDEIEGTQQALIYTQIHSGEWWTGEPDAGIGASYDVRCLSLTSGSWDVQAAVVGTYVGIDTAPEWKEVRTGGKGGEGPGTDVCIAQFQIRLGSSPFTVLATFEVDARATKP